MNWNDFISHLSKVAQEGSPPEYWDEFLKEKYQGGKKKVPNPNPKTRGKFQQVAVSTAMKFEQGTKRPVYEKLKKEYRQWLKDNGTADSGSLKPSTKPRSDAKPHKFLDIHHPNTYLKDRRVEVYYGKGSKDIPQWARDKYGSDPESFKDKAALIAGVASLKDVEVSIYCSDTNKIFVDVPESTWVKSMGRSLKYLEGKFVIKNDVLELDPNAPKGLGTRIFANQVIEAKRAGVDIIVCAAARMGNSYVGYKVWPKMGYDGEIPTNVLKNSLIRDYLDTKYPNHTKPFMVSDLLALPEGEELWDKYGDTFLAKFDLHNEKQLAVLQAYLDKKAKEEGKTVEEYLKMGRRLIV